MLPQYLQKLHSAAQAMCSQDDDEREIDLLIHSLLRLFTQDYGGESFCTLNDTHCREQFMTHYYDLYEVYETTDFHLYRYLNQFITQTQMFESVQEIVPEQYILCLYAEQCVNNSAKDTEALLYRLKQLTNNKPIIQDVSACFMVPKVMATTAMQICEETYSQFRYLNWSRWHEELEVIIAELKIEGV